MYSVIAKVTKSNMAYNLYSLLWPHMATVGQIHEITGKTWVLPCWGVVKFSQNYEAQSVQYVTYSKIIKITHFSIVLYVRN